MIFGSVCSGIEAASVAWHPLGWRAAFYSEIEKFPRAVLAHHYPDVPLHGDFTTIEAGIYDAIDLLAGGTPCQSFSIAGLRKGLTDDRGNLSLEFIRLASRLSPRWLVWENVPGVLSSNKGRDFGAFLGGLAECGYGFAYRVLDAQYFGVPQRRRRVFVVGYLGDWRPAAAVLFERESLLRDLTPRREKGKGIARCLRARANSSHREDSETLIASTGEVAHCLNAGGMGRQDYETETLITHTLRGEGHDASEDGTGRGVPLVPAYVDWIEKTKDLGGTIEEYRALVDSAPLPFDTAQVTSAANRSNPQPGDPCHTLHSGATHHVAYSIQGAATRENIAIGPGGIGVRGDDTAYTLEARAEVQVRRLTPRECERLQGFPDDYTLIPLPLKGRQTRVRWAADGPRYKALGNSWAVPKFRWLGERIQMVDDLIKEQPHGHS